MAHIVDDPVCSYSNFLTPAFYFVFSFSTASSCFFRLSSCATLVHHSSKTAICRRVMGLVWISPFNCPVRTVRHGLLPSLCRQH
uniref:Uncharacterized protein n=1 Tax=Leersia perrieri TaxID=77586 RepID=A0A0D9W233_9ORYZ